MNLECPRMNIVPVACIVASQGFNTDIHHNMLKQEFVHEDFWQTFYNIYADRDRKPQRRTEDFHNIVRFMHEVQIP